MERIIITEVDNTSNVEALSSFDVVYVPGFGQAISPGMSADGTPSLFRNPTLVTTRYQFLNLYGNVCPTFSKDQPYPIATSGTSGFPDYAIPDYVPPVTPTEVADMKSYTFDYVEEQPIDANTAIANIEEFGFYSNGIVTESSWTPETEVVYYLADRTDIAGESKSVFTMKPLPDTDSYAAGLIVFQSEYSPAANGLKVYTGTDYIFTDDEIIEFNGQEVKSYFEDSSKPAIMFNGPGEATEGDADPGYRYALYLLSLGIPVYYEQMNATWTPVDLDDPAMAAANPSANGWRVQVGENDYVKTQDTEVVEGKTYYYGADVSVESMYEGLELRFANRSDSSTPGVVPSDYSFDSMGDYAVKYITSGGYPTFEYGPLADPDARNKTWGTSGLAEQMIRLAADRSDAVALIDHTNAPNRSIYETDAYSVISRVRNSLTDLGTITGSYGAMFTPWYTCTSTYITGGTAHSYDAHMPASLAFLSALAQQLQNYNPWLAVSGVSRGVVPYCGGLHTNHNLTNNVADSYQVIPGDTQATESAAISINPITYIRNYGYCIWGNRTLRNNSAGTQATSFLNIRDLTSDIKKTLYEASQALMFEQNTDVLWLNFKALVTPILDRMVSNYILSDYNIVKYNVDPESGERVPAYKVLANIIIRPINSVEVFELRVTLENNDISVAETA